MTPLIADQLKGLQEKHPGSSANLLANGAHLIEIPNFPLAPGWNREATTLLFVAPPGYPTAPPDCFWVAPSGLRLAGGGTPQNTNDSNPIPGLVPPKATTWFSWHVQRWSPNGNALLTYLNVIKARLATAK